MAVAVSYPHIVKVEGSPARLERMPRIRVAQILMDYLFQGWSPDEICYQYPHLKPAEVHSAMGYYFDHQGEIEKEIEDEIKLVDEWRKNTPPSPIMLRLRAQRLLPPSGS
jgi:uncharacterized protein (DUF433 family)